MNHIFRQNAGKKINTISELFIHKFLILLLCHLNVFRLYVQLQNDQNTMPKEAEVRLPTVKLRPCRLVDFKIQCMGGNE